MRFLDDQFLAQLFDITITCEGIAKLLLNLNPNKAAGPDEIKPRVLKELATEIALICWKGYSMLYLSAYDMMLLTTMCSNSLQQIQVKEIGL
jgi:hypothetical protein